MPSASILLRLSKQAGETNLSLAGMRADCVALAERTGFDVHEIHVDDGISGAVRDRPGFVAWLDDGRTGKVDGLITYSGDRLTREGVNAAAMVLDVVEGKNPTTGAIVRTPIRFLTADDGLDSSGDPTGFRFNFVIKAEVARAERERIVSRNRAAQRRLRGEEGRFRGGECPYGYRSVPRERGGFTLEIDETESGVVREAARRVIAGESLYAVALDFTARGVPTRRGGPWRIPTLQSMLTGPHSAGYVRHRGDVARSEDGLPVRWFDPVLDDATLDQLRGIIRAPSRKRHARDVTASLSTASAGRKPKVSRLLSNLLRSACCDSPVYAISASPSKPRALYRQPLQGNSCGTQVGINAEPLEAHVEAEFLRRFGSMAEVRPVAAAEERADLAAVERALQDLGRAITAPNANVVEISAQIGSLHEQRARLASRPASAGPVRLEPTGRTVADAWHDGTTQTRNVLLRSHLEGPILLAPVGRARSVRRLDVDRVSIPWRGSDTAEPDYLAGQTD